LARRGLKLVNQLSVMSAVRDEVNFDLSVQDALARDYVNLSALARLLVPKISKRTRKKVKVEGVITALKRLREAFSPASHEIGKVIASSIVNVRTHVSKISVEKNRRTLQAVASMLSRHQEDFIQVSESLSTITLIFDQRLHGKVKKELSGGEILAEGDDLAAIIVQSPERIVSTPGCVIAFYNQLSRRHVNMEDTVSCHTDTIIVVKAKYAGKAFEALAELIDEERKRIE
jgi:aspartokinase